MGRNSRDAKKRVTQPTLTRRSPIGAGALAPMEVSQQEYNATMGVTGGADMPQQVTDWLAK